MIGVLDIIDRLPQELAARLESDPFFADIPVVVAEDGDVRAEMERKQAAIAAKSGRRGVAVIVLPLVGNDDYPNVAFGPMTLRPAFQVVEVVELNRDAQGTGKSARRVARRIRDVIKPLVLCGMTTEFTPDNPCIEPVKLSEEMGKVQAFQVNFLCYEADTEPVEQVGRPGFAAVPGAVPAVSLASTTEGAEIWYSIDESYPGPNRPGSALYSEPIPIPAAGLTVRAVARKAGLIDSQVSRATVTAEQIS